MARAKHTDRTEARRRYRAEQAAVVAADEVGQPLDLDTPAKVLAKPGAARSATGAGGARPGLMTVFRASFTTLDLGGDLRALPQIVRHWALLVSIAASIVASIVFIASTNEFGASLDFSLSDPLAGRSISSVSNLSYLVISLFVAPPPAAGAFLIGFTAKRASWLGGLLYGIVAAICYAAILLSPAGRLLTGSNEPGVYITNAALLAPVGALLFASAAAWYRRFLNLANPNRGRRPPKSDSRQKARPAAAKAGNRAR